jgi:hypothetical protein
LIARVTAWAELPTLRRRLIARVTARHQAKVSQPVIEFVVANAAAGSENRAMQI